MAKIDYTQMKSGESWSAYVKRIAKVADQRLVRLEDLSRTKTYKGVLEFAYKRAKSDIDSWTEGGLSKGQLPRFNRGISQMDDRQLKDYAMDIHRFLNSKTGTVGGINKYYTENAARLSDMMGLKEPMTWRDLAELNVNGVLSEANRSETYGSDTVFKTIGKVKKKIDKIKASIKKNKKITMTEDEIKESIDKYFEGKPEKVAFNRMLDAGLNLDKLIRG